MMNHMNVYLLKDHFSLLMFKPTVGEERATGNAEFFLREKMLSPTGKGAVVNKRFPWDIKLVEGRSSVAGLCGFNISIRCVVDNTYLLVPRLDIFAEGDFAEIFKYVHGIPTIPGTLKLKFSGIVGLAAVQFTKEFQVTSPLGGKGVSKFKTSARLSDNIVQHFESPVKSHVMMTLELMIEKEATPVSIRGFRTTAEALNEKILEQKCQTDFILIAQNDVELPCHKCFLIAHSSFFERMLNTDCKETKLGRVKLNLSEGGLKAFLQFVYCLRIDAPKEDPRIAVELLQFAHEKQISELEEEIKTLILGKPNDWLGLNEGLQLYLFSRKLEQQGYSNLKKKAVKAIKAKRLELKQSAVFQELLVSDPESVTDLMCSCLE